MLSGAIYWLYTQQVACDTHIGDCAVKISLHPEDRFMGYGKPDPGVVIVGIDNQSVKSIDHYPVRRDEYALALQNLEKAGAAVVAFDIGFPDPRDAETDAKFKNALAASKIPVVLSYVADNIRAADGILVQEGINQIPLRQFRCSDTSRNSKAPCLRPYRNVILAGIGGGGVDGGGTGMRRIVAATSDMNGAGGGVTGGGWGVFSGADSCGVGAHGGTGVSCELGGFSGT